MDIYLKKLELHGFKSFPDRTVIQFHKGITAVVGPNGCGKSNLVDALLWVLGEQRIKNLRGENNEDLIFNGSMSKQPLGMTEVEAIITHAAEEFYIARRFFRSGESKYILNEKYCRNKDIQDQLFKLSLGDRKYFIFEQGSIEKLVSFKPEEKRMLIEEAAEISQYLERKKETANKLIIAQQNLDNIEILIADKKNRLRELKNQLHYVERYRRIKTEKMENLKALLKKKYDAFQQDFKGHNQEIETFITQESLLIKEVAKAEKEVMAVEEERWNIDKELKGRQKDFFETNREIQAKNSEIEKQKQKKDFIRQKLQELEGLISRNNDEIKEIKENLMKEKQREDSLKKDLAEVQGGGGDINVELDRLKETLDELTERDSGFKDALFRHQGEASSLANHNRDVEKKIGRIENEISAKKNFIVKLKEEDAQVDLNGMTLEVNNINNQLQKQQESLDRLAERVAKDQAAVDELQRICSSAKNEKENLHNQREKYLEIKKKILADGRKETDSGKVVYVQELVQSERAHHQLIENFYYDEMDALVADGKDDWQRNFNKFLLNRVRDEVFPQGIDKEPGFISFVKDLFELKEKKVKDYLADGILVDTLAHGIALYMKYGVSVLTQTGEIISKNGVLIKKRQKGILDVISEIRTIEEKITQAEKSYLEKSKLLASAREKLQSQSQQLEVGHTELSMLEKKQLELKTRLEGLQKNREANQRRIEINESEIQLLDIELGKFSQELTKGEAKLKQVQQELEKGAAQREQLTARKDQLRGQLGDIEKVRLERQNQINLIQEKIKSTSTNISSLNHNQTKLNAGIRSSMAEIDRLNQESKEIDVSVAELQQMIKDSQQNNLELEKVIRQKEERFDALNTEINDRTARLNGSRQKLAEIKEQKSKLEIDASSTKKDLYQLEDLSFKELNCELNQIEASEEQLGKELSELEELVRVGDERLIKMRDSNKLNFSAESEYNLLDKEYGFLNNQLEDIEKSIEDMNAAIEKIDSESRKSFLEAFAKVQENFKKNFQILFEGGEAELALTDPDGNVLEGGLEIKAQPPGKRLQSLKLLSGGEKTLTSLAFLFSLFEYKPSPLCVFDEVDAALDEANVQKFLKFLHKLKERTQFLIITHNFKTMEEADYLYGISMEEPGISTIYSLKMTGKGKFEPQ